MKKHGIINITNWLLLFSIPLILLTTKVETNTVNSRFDTKNLATSFMIPIVNKESSIEEKEEDISTDIDKEIKNVNDKDVISKSNNKEITNEKNDDTIEVEHPEKEVVKETTPVSVQQTYKTYSGKMSFYKATCNGCSGYTSTGYNVSDGRLYYNDSTYGNVRIVAGGSEIPNYSIIRIKNSSFGSEIYAIKLDRGGDIGVGKRFLIDMLTNTEESKGGVEYNIVVEIIREGR